MNASIPRFLCAVAMIAVILPTPADAKRPGGRYVVTNGGTSNGTVYDTKTKLTGNRRYRRIPMLGPTPRHTVQEWEAAWEARAGAFRR